MHGSAACPYKLFMSTYGRATRSVRALRADLAMLMSEVKTAATLCSCGVTLKERSGIPDSDMCETAAFQYSPNLLFGAADLLLHAFSVASPEIALARTTRNRTPP